MLLSILYLNEVSVKTEKEERLFRPRALEFPVHVCFDPLLFSLQQGNVWGERRKKETGSLSLL